MSSLWGSILPSARVTDRSLSPDIDSISSVFSASSEELDQEMVESASPVAGYVASECNIEKDDEFYFQDDNVELIVENKLYNVPRTPLARHSAFFRGLFASPPDAQLPPGWSQQELIILDQVVVLYVQTATGVIKTTRPSITGSYREAYPLYGTTPREFTAFMSVLYPKNYARHDLTTVAEWTSVLKLATIWDFESIRELAIERLRPLLRDSPVKMLVAARSHYVNEWADQALRTLVERDEPLDDFEAAQLDLADVMYIVNEQRVRAIDRSVASLRAHPLLMGAFKAKEEAERNEVKRKEREEQDRKEKAEAARKAEAERKAEVVRKEAERRAAEAAERDAKADKVKAERKEAEAKEASEEAERNAAEAVERKAKARKAEETARKAKEEERLAEEKADRAAKEAKECKEREEAEARHLVEEAQKKAERREAERRAEEARLAKEEAYREAEEERARRAAATAAKAEEERLAKEAEDARLAKEKAEREAGKERTRAAAAKAEEERIAKKREAEAERARVAAAKVEEEPIAQENGYNFEVARDATAQAEKDYLEQEKTVQEIGASRQKEGLEENKARTADEAGAHQAQRVHNGAQQASISSDPSTTGRILSASASKPVTRPAPPIRPAPTIGQVRQNNSLWGRLSSVTSQVQTQPPQALPTAQSAPNDEETVLAGSGYVKGTPDDVTTTPSTDPVKSPDGAMASETHRPTQPAVQPPTPSQSTTRKPAKKKKPLRPMQRLMPATAFITSTAADESAVGPSQTPETPATEQSSGEPAVAPITVASVSEYRSLRCTPYDW